MGLVYCLFNVGGVHLVQTVTVVAGVRMRVWPYP